MRGPPASLRDVLSQPTSNPIGKTLPSLAPLNGGRDLDRGRDLAEAWTRSCKRTTQSMQAVVKMITCLWSCLGSAPARDGEHRLRSVLPLQNPLSASEEGHVMMGM